MATEDLIPEVRRALVSNHYEQVDLHPKSRYCLGSKRWDTELPQCLKDRIPDKDWKVFMQQLNDLEARLCNEGWAICLICSCICIPYAKCVMPKMYERISLCEADCVVQWNAQFKRKLNIDRDFMFFQFDASQRTLTIFPSKFFPVPKARRGRHHSLQHKHIHSSECSRSISHSHSIQ